MRGERPTAQHPAGRMGLPRRFRLLNGAILEPGWYVIVLHFKPEADEIVFSRSKGMEILQSTYKALGEGIDYRVSRADTDGDGVIDEKERLLAFDRPPSLKLEDAEEPLLSYSGGPSAMNDRSSFPECAIVTSKVTAPLEIKEIATGRERASLDLFPGREQGSFVLEITFGLYQDRTGLSVSAPRE